jgi:hypothetical protein
MNPPNKNPRIPNDIMLVPPQYSGTRNCCGTPTFLAHIPDTMLNKNTHKKGENDSS